MYLGTKQQTKDGSLVRKCRVADRTGSIMFSIWNEEAEAVNTGDIIKLTRGYGIVRTIVHQTDIMCARSTT